MRLKGLKTEWYEGLTEFEKGRIHQYIDLLIMFACIVVIVVGFLVAG